MAANQYQVTWKNQTTGVSDRRTVPASSIGAALNGVRHHMDIARGGVKHEVLDIRIERVA